MEEREATVKTQAQAQLLKDAAGQGALPLAGVTSSIPAPSLVPQEVAEPSKG